MLMDLARMVCPDCEGQCCRGQDTDWDMRFRLRTGVIHGVSGRVGMHCDMQDRGGCGEGGRNWHCRHLYCNMVGSIYMGELDGITIMRKDWKVPKLRDTLISVMEE